MLKNYSRGIINTFVGPPRNDTERDARTTGAALVWALVIGLVFAISWEPKFWPSACMWAGASTFFGMLLGFLFGIPRFIARTGVPAVQTQPQTQGGQTPSGPQQPQAQDGPAPAGLQQPQAQDGQAPAGLQQPQAQDGQPLAGQQLQAGVNTNLEEISDWLTKIIVGVSLVELQKAQVKLQDTAAFIAQSIGGPAQTSFAYGLMAYFSISGFLGSYLLTRLYLQRAFRDAASGE
jgi:hypothetical protein